MASILCFSELRELVEKQSDLILDLNCKIEECNQNLKETNSELETVKLENIDLKVSLAQQNTKFENLFENLEQEGNSIKNTMSKQKVHNVLKIKITFQPLQMPVSVCSNFYKFISSSNPKFVTNT